MTARNSLNFKPLLLSQLNEHLRRLRRRCLSLNFWLVLTTDVALLITAYFLSRYLRFDAFHLTKPTNHYIAVILVILAVKLPIFYLFGLYNGMWRYTGFRDLQRIVGAALVSSSVIITIMTLVDRFHGYSRGVFIMDAVFTILFISGSRASIRMALHHSALRREDRVVRLKRLLVIGAGDAAEKATREIDDNPTLPYEVVGFVDDDPDKAGLRIHRIPVLGGVDDLPEFAAQTQADELLIAIVTLTGPEMQRIVALCQQTGLPYKVLPGLGELINGRVSVSSIRDISYKDLLGREEVTLDQARIGDTLRGKIILVTGAGGSIGSELCRQIIRFAPSRLILFDSSEENLYAIQMELLHEYQVADAVPVLGKVQDVRLLDMVFNRHRPQVVFHAAAYKHVPLVENNPWEAVYNNIFASQLLIEAVIRHRVERFVLVSTDKAVRPTNVMGASKRLTELLMLAYARNSWDGGFSPAWRRVPETAEPATYRAEAPHHDTRFMAVRFGNVLGSSGSVLPLFKRQIELGGPVTVTHPEITRYFMSIEEAAQLILQAGSMGGDGEIFLLKMGEPVRIDQMARDMIRLAGKEPDVDIEIRYSGLRPGEKLFEELITEGEGIVPTGHQKIMVLGSDGICFTDRERMFDELLRYAGTCDGDGIKGILKQIIPEYTPYRETAVTSMDKDANEETLRN
ncbi:MAG: polysaccharide biosynthesis protein [Desulfoprunum sp.]